MSEENKLIVNKNKFKIVVEQLKTVLRIEAEHEVLHEVYIYDIADEEEVPKVTKDIIDSFPSLFTFLSDALLEKNKDIIMDLKIKGNNIVLAFKLHTPYRDFKFDFELEKQKLDTTQRLERMVMSLSDKLQKHQNEMKFYIKIIKRNFWDISGGGYNVNATKYTSTNANYHMISSLQLGTNDTAWVKLKFTTYTGFIGLGSVVNNASIFYGQNAYGINVANGQMTYANANSQEHKFSIKVNEEFIFYVDMASKTVKIIFNNNEFVYGVPKVTDYALIYCNDYPNAGGIDFLDFGMIL